MILDAAEIVPGFLGFDRWFTAVPRKEENGLKN
jgi:hypothetical protein